MAAANAEVWHSVEKKKKAPALEINSYHEAEMCHPSGLPAVRYVCNVCKDVACTSKLQLQVCMWHMHNEPHFTLALLDVSLCLGETFGSQCSWPFSGLTVAKAEKLAPH